MQQSLQTLVKTPKTEPMSSSCVSKMGWCVGCNPPSVVCGIRLIGLPAPSVDTSSATVCPFHLQDGRFTGSKLAHSTSQMRHSQVQLDVSFLLRCQRSRAAPYGAAILHVGGVSSDPHLWGPKPHTNSPAHLKSTCAANKHNLLANKNYRLHFWI